MDVAKVKLNLYKEEIVNSRKIRIIAQILESIFIMCTRIFENIGHFYTLGVLNK
jgi:hypothetical protein